MCAQISPKEIPSFFEDVHSRLQWRDVTEANKKIRIAVVAEFDVNLDREGVYPCVRPTSVHLVSARLGFGGGLAFNGDSLDKNRLLCLPRPLVSMAIGLAKIASVGAHGRGALI